MKREKRNSILQDESGVLTLDFIFSFSMCFALILILMAMSFSLAAFEVTQYVTFAVARSYAGAHASVALQEQEGQRKFDQLVKNTPAISSLYSGGWYRIVNNKPEIGDFNQEYGADRQRETFVGARVTLNAKVLEMHFPILGNTFEDEDGFTSRFASFLLRSPSYEECHQWNEQRFDKLKTLGYDAVPAQGAFVMSDNGC